MARFVILGISPGLRTEGLLPSRSKRNQAYPSDFAIVHAHFWSVPGRLGSPASMRERIRGKPKRGSPWKPRRPPASPSASPMTGSSLHPQSSSPTASPPPAQSVRRRSAISPPPKPSQLLHSMATLPRALPPSQRGPEDPRMHFVATMSFPASSSTWRSAPSAFADSKRLILHSATQPDGEHFRERLGILFDLVFELRREVADYKFRLQATEDNVASFLHTLSAMHSELSLDPSGIPMGEAHDADMEGVLRQAATRKRPAEHSDPVENKEREVTKEQFGNEQPSNTAAEPWAEELRDTWLGFSTGV